MEQEVGKAQLLQRGLECLHQVVGQLGDKPHRVGDQHGAGVGDLQVSGRGVQRVEKPVVGRNVRAGERVEKGGLPRIGIAHDGHHRHLVLDAPLPLDPPDPPHLLQILLQLGDLLPDMPPVGLQLSLAGPSGTDGGLSAGSRLPDQVPPHTREAGQEILILGQLHLEPPLLCPGPLCEDVENECGAVHHRHPQLLREHSLLGGGKGVVKDDHVRPRRLRQRLHLRRLALADKSSGVRGVLILEHRPHTGSPRRLQQGGELLHGGLRGVLLPAQAGGIQAHQYRAVDFLFCRMVRHSTSGATAPYFF